MVACGEARRQPFDERVPSTKPMRSKASVIVVWSPSIDIDWPGSGSIGAEAPGLDHGVPGRAGDDRRQVLDLAGEGDRKVEPHVAAHGRLEEDVELSGRILLDLEIGRPHLMRRGGRQRRQSRTAQQECARRSSGPASSHRQVDLRLWLEQRLDTPVEFHAVFFAQPRKVVLALFFCSLSRRHSASTLSRTVSKASKPPASLAVIRTRCTP